MTPSRAVASTPSLQLATLVDEPPGGEDWLHEVKFDGYRVLARLEDGRVRLLTRNGHDWSGRYPRVARAVEGLPADEAVIDGELVALDERGRSDFQALQRASGSEPRLFYFAFDLLRLDGKDLRSRPLVERKAALRDLLRGPESEGGAVRFSAHVRGRGEAFHREACLAGLEGSIAKRADAPYTAGRGRDWRKVKCRRRQEFVVVGFTEPSGDRIGLGSLVLAVHERGRLRRAGRVGTGFREETLRRLRRSLEPFRRSEPPVADPPGGARGREIRWVEPALVVEVAFTEWTDDGRIRHPVFEGVREDRDPASIVRERPAPGPDTAARSARPAVDAGGVRLTHPDRVLYPEQGLTKRDLVRYWESVAEAALPGLLDRPLALLRCPEGRGEGCFWQKHPIGSRNEIPVVPLGDEDGLHMIVRDPGDVLSLVQLGALELHVRGCLSDRPERPDRLVLDLDPGEGVDWTALREGALAVRGLLEELDLEGFVRTTGGEGLHVVVPLVRRNTWEEAKTFTRGVATRLARERPEAFTAHLSKRERENRIFLDYLRNQRGATSIATWSPRARPGAPVAVPLSWEELLSAEGLPRWTVETAPARADRDPWRRAGSIRQSLSRARRRALGL